MRLSPGGASFNPLVGCFCPFCGTFCCPLWVASDDLYDWAVSRGDRLVSLPFVSMGIFCFRWIYFGSMWISQHGAMSISASCWCYLFVTRSAVLRQWQDLEWLDLFIWQVVCGLISFQAKFLKRFKFESLVYPRLGVEFLKHYLIECSCRRIVWFSSPWITQFKFLFTSLNEVWPTYLLWSWINLVAEVLVVFFAIYK